MLNQLKKRRRQGGIFLGYILFALLMFAFFLYLTFPFSLLESRLIAAIESKSGCKVAVGERGIFFPLRLAWREIQVDCPQAPVSRWKIASIEMKVAPVALLLNRKGEIDFRIKIAEGEIVGHATVVRTPEGPSISLKHEGKRLNLAEIGLSGLLDLQGEENWIVTDPMKGKGSLTFTATEVKLKQIGSWSVPVGELFFANIRGKVNLNNGVVTVERFTAQGNEVDLASDGGNLLLREPFAGSLLSLALKATPKGSLQQAASLFVQGYRGGEPLTVGVKGSIGQPQFSLNGKPIPFMVSVSTSSHSPKVISALFPVSGGKG